VFHATFGPDPAVLAAEVARPEVRAHLARIEAEVDDRRVIVRSDRMELSKNIVRGFLAFDTLLEDHPEWRERVTFVAMCNPSRESLIDYVAYRQEVETVVARINDRWHRGSWTPIVLDVRDDHARSLAAFVRADVLLVNPVRDGLNLVALEGPLCNGRDAVLCLSREAGAFELLADGALEVHPFDVLQTAEALARALDMPAGERSSRAALLRAAARSHPPESWLEALVERARRTSARRR
jgi:trehalose 6-phosphate synthase